MKTSLECLPCLLDQTIRVVKMQGCNEIEQERVVKAVASLLPGLNLQQTPPANSMSVYAAIASATGCTDPYLEVKREENRRALQHLTELREQLRKEQQPLFVAIGFAIAGNVIDYGTVRRFDIAEAFGHTRLLNFALDQRKQLLLAIDGLKSGAKVLYLTDNCGEIVYDSLVIEMLAARGLQVTVAVKAGPIINDALLEDAEMAGLGNHARIITNGAVCPGTPLEHCSTEFLELFEEADLVISKGQGNFETLSEVDREIFFLLTVKCAVVGRHLAHLSGIDGVFDGNGEMVVYHQHS